jgi:carboxymethylenebutenolidase
MRGDRLCHEHISWDQGTVLEQLGLLPDVVGMEVEGKKYEVKLPVVGVEGGRKLVDEGCEKSNGLIGRGWKDL